MDAVADLEQFLEFVADNEDGDARVTQIDKLLADGSGGADVDAPCGLRGDQNLGFEADLAADDELLEVSTREAARLCVGACPELVEGRAF